MYGLLRRLFAPRWQHPDPEVRRQALARLDPNQTEQREALQALAHDSESDIRLAALLALDDVKGLVEAYPDHCQQEAWFNAMYQRLSGLEGNTDLHQRQALVEQLDEPRLLNAIALQGDNLNLRLTALARLTDDNDLITQACHNGVATVRHRAAERIEDEESLKRLLKEARRDRHVVRLAREKLGQKRTDAEWLAQQQQQREQLLQQLEQQSRAPWEPLYGGRLRHLEREWKALTQPPSAEQEQRFHHAMLGCRRTLHDHETQEQARQQSLARRDEAERTRNQLLDGLEETLEGLHHATEITEQDIDSLRAQRQLFSQRWQALSDLHTSSESARQRYTQAIVQYEQCLDAWQRWQDISVTLEQALTDNDYSAMKRLLKACAWPKTLTPPALIQRAQATLATEPQETDDSHQAPASLSTYEAELDSFEHLLERGAFENSRCQAAESTPETTGCAPGRTTRLARFCCWAKA